MSNVVFCELVRVVPFCVVIVGVMAVVVVVTFFLPEPVVTVVVTGSIWIMIPALL